MAKVCVCARVCLAACLCVCAARVCAKATSQIPQGSSSACPGGSAAPKKAPVAPTPPCHGFVPNVQLDKPSRQGGGLRPGPSTPRWVSRAAAAHDYPILGGT